MSVILSGQLLSAVLVLAALYSLVAIGLNLVYGTMRLLNVAHGELVMLGGYVAYWGFVKWGISPLLSAVAAMALGAALGTLVFTMLIRRMFASPRLLARVEVQTRCWCFSAFPPSSRMSLRWCLAPIIGAIPISMTSS